ncbi:MAG: hypothetical protein ACJAYG_002336 [Oceanicoccus sp.]|jgi:hypothetical protein
MAHIANGLFKNILLSWWDNTPPIIAMLPEKVRASIRYYFLCFKAAEHKALLAALPVAQKPLGTVFEPVFRACIPCL